MTDCFNEQVFNQCDAIDQNFVSSTLSIGAFEPSMCDSSYLSNKVGYVTVHKKNGLMDSETIFEFHERNGVRKFWKNLHNSVYIVGSNLSFRNPVHFIHFADRNGNQP
jgi:hypothetical protein